MSVLSGSRPDVVELVAREHDLAALHAALGTASTGPSRVALVTGEARGGKTALSNHLCTGSLRSIPVGRHFCLYALQSVLPLLPAKQRELPAEDWREQDTLACCPDPEERLIMRTERSASASCRPRS